MRLKSIIHATLAVAAAGALPGVWQAAAHAQGMAQNGSDATFSVGDIRIEGLQRISEGTVYNYLPVNIGDQLDQLLINLIRNAADASLELLMRRAGGWRQPYFRLEGYRVTSYHRNALRAGAPIEDGEALLDTEATVKLWAGDERMVAVGEGNGPVNALDAALRSVLTARYPALADIRLTDYRVRVLEGSLETDAVVRVIIESTNGTDDWSTVGVSTNIIEASWQALVDSIAYGLLHASPSG